MKPKKISFFGNFGRQNLGNECTLQAILYHTRKFHPDSEISCICTGPDDASARHKIPAFPVSARLSNNSASRVWPGHNNILIRTLRIILIRSPMELLHWFKVFKVLKSVDMLVMPGTGMLGGFHVNLFGLHYEIFKWSIIAKICQCKLLFVSVGAGPLFHPLNKFFIKSALSLADYRSYRDSFSKNYLKGIGFESNNDAVYPDLAFSLPMSIMPRSANLDRQKPVVGIGVMDYSGQRGDQREGGAIYQEYIDKTSSFVAWLLKHNYSVRVLSGDGLYDGRPRKDLRKSLEMRGFKYANGQVLDEEPLSVEQLLSHIASTDFVISPRYHNILLAIMLNKPVISLSYNEKFESLMAGVGLAEYCQHIEQLNVERLIKQFKKLVLNAENIKPQIKQKKEEYRRTLDEQYRYIFNDV